MSREHIWADWLKAYLPRDMASYESLYATEFRTHVQFTRKTVGGDIRSRRVKCVCKRCNNGWMSQLQTKVKPIAIPLMSGLPCTLGHREREILAGWVAMAAVAVDRMYKGKSAISAADCKYIFKHKTPPPLAWRIYVGHFKRAQWKNHLARHHLLITEDVDERDNVHPIVPNTQTTTYVVGELFIHVISSSFLPVMIEWDFPDGRPVYLREIWPNHNSASIWPPPTMSDSEADFVATTFFDWAKRGGRPE